jgi:hypothetical protein
MNPMKAAKASAQVIRDLASNPNLTCEGCDQPLADHKFACRMAPSRKGEKRGGKDDCQFCAGPGHNAREKKGYQSQACAGRIVLGELADTTSFMDLARAVAAAYSAAPFRYAFDGADGASVKLVAHPGIAAKAKASASGASGFKVVEPLTGADISPAPVAAKSKGKRTKGALGALAS